MITDKSSVSRSRVLAVASMVVCSLHLEPATAATNCPLSVSGASQATLTVDGVLLTRYARGMRGAALTAELRPSPALPSTVEASIDAAKTALDVDDDGAFTPTDALILARSMAGMPSIAWTSGITFGATAKRTDANLIAQYVASGCAITGAGTIALGSNSEGTGTDTITDSTGAYINANRFQAQSSLTVTTLYAKVAAISGKYQMALYEDASGSPGALLTSSVEVTPSTTGWHRFALKTPLAVTAGTSYWLSIWSNDSAARVYSSSGGTLRWGKYAYSTTWPTAVVLNSGGAFTYSMYASDGAPLPVSSANVVVSGNTQYQRIVGMGANANSNAWENGALRPALDKLIDEGGVSMWRVIVESHEGWETSNDDNDPFNFNWSYYNALYETPKFQSLWAVLDHLKARNAPYILLNVMGEVPQWMGRNAISTNREDEWVELITSMLVYARSTKQLRIDAISPMNEQDLGAPEGPGVNATQYVRLMNKLRVRMDALGLGDIRFYGPETANVSQGVNTYMPAMLADANLMARVAGFALHDYSGGSGGAADRIRNSSYPDRPFVMTEFSAWCSGCDTGAPQPTDFDFATTTGLYVMRHLGDGAAGTLVYDAYDSYYEHHGSIGYWGLLGRNTDGTYFARKRMQVLAQFSRYIRPGATRVAVSSQVSGVSALAFTSGGPTALVAGYNSNGSSVDLTIRFDNTSSISTARLIQTSSSKDQETSAPITVSNNNLSVRVDANSFFTVVAQ